MSNDDLSRRDALSGGAAALVAGVGAALAVSAVTRDAEAQSNPSDAAKLNTLLAAEFDAIATYTAAIGYLTGTIPMTDTGRDTAPTVSTICNTFKTDHTNHASQLSTLITGLGGTPVTPPLTPMIPAGFPTSVANLIKLAANKEKAAAIAYSQTLTTISTVNAAALIAAIGGIETSHFVILYMAAKGALTPNTMMGAMLNQLAPASFVALTGTTSTLANVANLPFTA